MGIFFPRLWRMVSFHSALTRNDLSADGHTEGLASESGPRHWTVVVLEFMRSGSVASFWLGTTTLAANSSLEDWWVISNIMEKSFGDRTLVLSRSMSSSIFWSRVLLWNA